VYNGEEQQDKQDLEDHANVELHQGGRRRGVRRRRKK
jgi:hypothetical protein